MPRQHLERHAVTHESLDETIGQPFAAVDNAHRRSVGGVHAVRQPAQHRPRLAITPFLVMLHAVAVWVAPLPHAAGRHLLTLANHRKVIQFVVQLPEGNVRLQLANQRAGVVKRLAVNRFLRITAQVHRRKHDGQNLYAALLRLAHQMLDFQQSVLLHRPPAPVRAIPPRAPSLHPVQLRFNRNVAVGLLNERMPVHAPLQVVCER